MTPPPAATAVAEPLAPPRSAPPARPASRPRPVPSGPVVRRPALRRPRVNVNPKEAVAGAGVAGAGLLARLFSGRRLILLLGAALIGLVFLQVNLLRINTTMSADVEKAQLLQRDNASKRALIAQMGAGRRVEDAAASLGMVMPGATEVCYLKIGRKDNCPDGLSAVSGDAAGDSGDTAVAPTDATDATGTDGTGQAGETTTGQDQPAQEAPVAQQQPAPQEPQAQPDSGGLAAGTGGGG